MEFLYQTLTIILVISLKAANSKAQNGSEATLHDKEFEKSVSSSQPYTTNGPPVHIMPSMFTSSNYTRPLIPQAHCPEEYKRPIVIQKWDKYVPYILDDEMPENNRKFVSEAILIWNNAFKNCIEFTERKSEKDYVKFINGTTCYSSTGKKSKGEQFISLAFGDVCADRTSRIHHEMMHTIGLGHEHQRPDRDNYIEVFFNNIPENWTADYLKEEDFFFSELKNLPYDYYSIMHYHIFAPDDYVRPAYRILDDDVDIEEIGFAKDFSTIDITKVKLLYCNK